MLQAYRYRLEYSERRERKEFAIQICLWHRSTTWKPHNLSKRACRQTESSRIEVVLFSNANWIASSDHRSINMPVASLLQMRIVPLFFGFFEAIFLAAKGTRFWLPKAHFRLQSLCFRVRVMSATTLAKGIPLVSAREPLFRRAETTS